MKLFAYVGSYRGENSICMQVTKKIIGNIQASDIYISDIIIRTPNDTNIHECVGCTKCFFTGICNIKDGFKVMEKEMLESDIVLFSTPVFAHNVSGNFKIFIDRISHWLHVMRLSGKLGVPIVITSTNGAYEVLDYVEKIMEYLGISIIAKVAISNDIMTKKAIDSIIDVSSVNIINNIKNRNFPISDRQELYYKLHKDKIINEPAEDYRKRYWEDNNYFKYDTFSDMFLANRITLDEDQRQRDEETI